jgi:hypothetical protein
MVGSMAAQLSIAQFEQIVRFAKGLVVPSQKGF